MPDDTNDEALARNTDPDTSHAAAESVDVNRTEEIVTRILGEEPDGLTTEEIAEKAGMRAWSISPRMRPLEMKGKVARKGKRKNASGRMAIVWGLAEPEEPAEAAHDDWVKRACSFEDPA